MSKKKKRQKKELLPKKVFAPLPLNRYDYLFSVIVFIFSFLVYLKTLAPTVTAEDSGELITAAYTLGIAHPPGYPIWCIPGKIFTLFPIGNIAFRVNLMSAFFASLTAAVLYFLIRHIFSFPLEVFFGRQNPKLPQTDRSEKNVQFAALVSSLCFAFSLTFWSQAVITEVYTLNAFFVALIMLILLVWKREKKKKYLYWFSFIYGLSLTNHHSMILLGPVYLIYILFNERRAKTLYPMLLLFILGLSVYLYLPIRSLANPPIDWGNPETVKNFFDHILRKQYSALSKQPRSFFLFFKQTGNYLFSLSRQFTPYLGIIGLFGLWRSFSRKKTFLLLFSAFFVSSFGSIIILSPELERESLNAVEVFYIPSYLFFSLWLAGGIGYLCEKMKKLKYLFLFLPLLPLVANFHSNDKSRYHFAYNYGINIFRTLHKNAIVFTSSDYQSFPLTYLQIIENKRKDVVICDIYGDLSYALLGEDYNHASRKVRQEIQDRLILKMIEDENRPVYYLLKRDLSTLPGYEFQPRGITYKLVKKGTKEFYLDYWQNYNLSGVDNSSIYLDYTTSLIVSAYHYFRAEEYLYQGRIEEAIREFDKVAKLSHNVKEIYNNLGSALAEKREYILATRQYEKALKIDPHYAMAWINLGNVCKDRGEIRRAITYYKRALKIDLQDLRGHRGLAQVYEEQKNYSLALEEYLAVIKIQPGYFPAYNALVTENK